MLLNAAIDGAKLGPNQSATTACAKSSRVFLFEAILNPGYQFINSNEAQKE
jgi:hypothetical protein